MIRKILYFSFCDLFGNCKPKVVNDWPDVVQVKYCIAEMEAEMIWIGLEQLKKKYDGKCRVRVLFVYPGILQVILGSEEAVSRIGETDFRIDVC